MSFEKLMDNLLVELRGRVRNGEITERSLARRTGVSQPHIHNVLKGVRLLTPELSDRILHEMKLNVGDLLGAGAQTDEIAIPIIRDPVGRNAHIHGNRTTAITRLLKR